MLRDRAFDIGIPETPYSTPVSIRPVGDFELEVHVAPQPGWTPRNQAVGITFHYEEDTFLRASAMHWDGWHVAFNGTVVREDEDGAKTRAIDLIGSRPLPPGTPGFSEGFRLTVTRRGALVSAAVGDADPVAVESAWEGLVSVGLEVECLQPETTATLTVERVVFRRLAAGEGPEFAEDGLIAFARSTGAGGEPPHKLFLAREDGSVLRQLTHGETDDRAPAISPDGKLVAYEARAGEAADIFVVPVEGGEPARVTTGGVSSAPRWSPDGRQVIFARATPQGSRVFRAPAEAGGEARQQQIALGRRADVSPDTTEVISIHYVRGEDGPEWRLLSTQVREEAGASRPRTLQALAAAEGALRSVAWSPDGGDLLLTTEHEGRSGIYLVTADGKLPRPVPLQRGALAASPQAGCWSPDGKQILYAAALQGRGESRELYLMRRDGFRTRLLVEPEGDADYTEPHWWRPGYSRPAVEGGRVIHTGGAYQVRGATSPQYLDLEGIDLESDFRLELEIQPSPGYQARRQMVSVVFHMDDPRTQVHAGVLDFPAEGAEHEPRPFAQIKRRQAPVLRFEAVATEPLPAGAASFAGGFQLGIARSGGAITISINGEPVLAAECLADEEGAARPLTRVRLALESDEAFDGAALVLGRVFYVPPQ